MSLTSAHTTSGGASMTTSASVVGRVGEAQVFVPPSSVTVLPSVHSVDAHRHRQHRPRRHRVRGRRRAVGCRVGVGRRGLGWRRARRRWPTSPLGRRRSASPRASSSSAPGRRPTWRWRRCRCNACPPVASGSGSARAAHRSSRGGTACGSPSPSAATRETIDIVRAVARGDRLEHDGAVYQMPVPDGRGRPMRSMLPPADVPIYVASLGPRNLELTGELADGWLGNAFLPEHAEAFLEPLRAGATRAGRTLADLDLVMPVAVEFTDDVEEAASTARPRVRLHDRGDGLEGPELLQRGVRPAGLRRRRRGGAGAVAGRQAGGGGGRGCRSTSG